jgi:dienelactone hydrolase
VFWTPSRAVASVAALAMLSLPVVADAAARTVTIRAASGRTFDASLNEASQRPAPAVVLVGMLGKSRDDWQAIAQRFADARVTTLAIDLPGSVVPEDPKVLSAWSDDVRAAVTYLVGRPETKPGAIGILGASLGASLAAVAAGAEPVVRSLVLVSPTAEYRGLRLEGPMRQYGARPAYLLASQLDTYSARTVRDLAKNPPGIRETQLSDTSAHGTVLLAREPDLVRLIIEWFQRTLG